MMAYQQQQQQREKQQQGERFATHQPLSDEQWQNLYNNLQAGIAATKVNLKQQRESRDYQGLLAAIEIAAKRKVKAFELPAPVIPAIPIVVPKSKVPEIIAPIALKNQERRPATIRPIELAVPRRALLGASAEFLKQPTLLSRATSFLAKAEGTLTFVGAHAAQFVAQQGVIALVGLVPGAGVAAATATTATLPLVVMAGGMLAFNIIRQWRTIVQDPVTGIKKAAIGVAGTLASNKAVEMIGTFVPVAGTLAAVGTAWIGGVGQILLKPETPLTANGQQEIGMIQAISAEQRQKLIDANAAALTSKLLAGEEKEGNDTDNTGTLSATEKAILLQRLNENKRSILASIAIGATATALAATTIATGSAQGLVQGLWYAYRNDVPVIGSSIGEALSTGLTMAAKPATDAIADQISKRVEQLAGDVKIAVPEVIRKNVSEAMVHEIALRDVLRYSTRIAVQVTAQQTVSQVMATAKKWDTLEDALADLDAVRVAAEAKASALLETARLSGRTIASVADLTAEVFQAGLHAITDAGKAEAELKGLENAGATAEQVDAAKAKLDKITERDQRVELAAAEFHGKNAAEVSAAASDASVDTASPSKEVVGEGETQAQLDAAKAEARSQARAQAQDVKNRNKQARHKAFEAAKAKAEERIKFRQQESDRKVEADNKSRQASREASQAARERAGERLKSRQQEQEKRFEQNLNDLLATVKTEYGVSEVTDLKSALDLGQTVAEFDKQYPGIRDKFKESGLDRMEMEGLLYQGAKTAASLWASGGLLSGTASRLVNWGSWLAYNAPSATSVRKTLDTAAVAAAMGQAVGVSGAETAQTVFESGASMARVVEGVSGSISNLNPLNHIPKGPTHTFNQGDLLRAAGYLEGRGTLISNIILGDSVTSFVSGIFS